MESTGEQLLWSEDGKLATRKQIDHADILLEALHIDSPKTPPPPPPAPPLVLWHNCAWLTPAH